jgi:diguanylate cyclase (GGDEF)-like protein
VGAGAHDGEAWTQGEAGIFALEDGEYALFAEMARPCQAEAGQYLFRRGEPGDVMYVIGRGRIELDFGDDQLRRCLGAGACFGELGFLIGKHPRNADALALEDSALLALGRDVFETLARRDPHVLAQFLRRITLRMLLNEHKLIGRLRRRNQALQETLDALQSASHRLDQSEALARTDELTGLTNRRGLLLHLERLQREGRLAGHALILVDCDRFKAVNDVHGHLVGDRVLQSVANLLRAVAGNDDLACRLGGDEFCLLLQGHDREQVGRIAGYIVDSARMLERMQRHPPQMVTLSVGVCMIDAEHATSWERCYARVDQALYRAKRRGGGQVQWLE